MNNNGRYDLQLRRISRELAVKPDQVMNFLKTYVFFDKARKTNHNDNYTEYRETPTIIPTQQEYKDYKLILDILELRQAWGTRRAGYTIQSIPENLRTQPALEQRVH